MVDSNITSHIIGLCGKRQSGKDTFAQLASTMLKPHISVATISYAAPIKNFAVDYLGIDRRCVDGTNGDKDCAAGEWGDFFSDEICSEYIKTKRSVVTGRQVLQIYGTDVFRSANPNIWMNLLEDRIQKGDFDTTNDECFIAPLKPKVIFITDVRFPNEVDRIRKINGKVIKLDRELFGLDTHSSESHIDAVDESLFYKIYRASDLDGLEAVEDRITELFQELRLI